MIPASPPDPVFPSKLIARLRLYARPLNPIPTNQPARLMRLTGIRAVLFDVYGTLFVSASGDISASDGEVRSRALGRALEAMEIPVDQRTSERAAEALVAAINHSHERLKVRGVEYPEVDIRNVVLEVLEYLHARGLGREEPDRAFCEALAVEYECHSNPTWPMPGLAETLRNFTERGVKLGIVSNAQFYTPLLFPAYLDKSLESLGFDADLCIWSYRLLEAKPSPQLFHRALAVLTQRGIEPEEVLYVGNDRINDVRPAALAGMRTALFAGDSRSFRPREDDPRIGNVREDLLLTDLSQLPDVIEML